METTHTNSSAERYVNPDCHACNGTGEDTAFGGSCSECTHQQARDALLQARYANVPSAGGFHTPGERLDGRTFGASTTSGAASAKQISYLASLGVDVDAQSLTKEAASALIEEALAAKPAPAANTRSNRFAGTCSKCGSSVEAGAGLLGGKPGAWTTTHKDGECVEATAAAPTTDHAADVNTGGLDLSHVPSGTYAVPGSDSRLKVRIDNVDKPGKWNGWVFVKDGAEYGQQRRYGSQRPGGTYSGQITAELEVIAADPRAAAAAYGAITGRCCCCGRQLEDAESVARGIGPICAQKF